MNKTRRIGIFGGTFDPPHLGHLHIARVARDEFSLDEIRFVPARISPHKTTAPPTPAHHRLAMLRIALEEFSHAMVDERELHRAGASYSWETAESFQRELPNARLFWLMGADQWLALPRWAEPEKLAACVQFLVFPRNEIPVDPRLGFILHRLHAVHPASATELRRELAKSPHHPWLPAGVAEYIARHKLYHGVSSPGT